MTYASEVGGLIFRKPGRITWTYVLARSSGPNQLNGWGPDAAFAKINFQLMGAGTTNDLTFYAEFHTHPSGDFYAVNPSNGRAEHYNSCPGTFSGGVSIGFGTRPGDIEAAAEFANGRRSADGYPLRGLIFTPDQRELTYIPAAGFFDPVYSDPRVNGCSQ